MSKGKKPDIGITTNIKNTNIRNESTTVNHKEIYDYVFNVDNRQMIQLNNYVVNITNSLQQMAAKGQEAAKKLNMEEANKKLAETFKQVSGNIKLISDSVKGFANVADIFGGMGKEGKKTTDLFEKFKLALNDTITQALQPLIRIFNEGMAPILAIIANGFQKLGTSLGPLITIIGQLLQAGLQAIVPILQGLGNILVFVVQWVVNLLAPLGGLISGISNLVPIMTILVAVIAGIKIASLIGMIPQLVAAFFAWAGSAGAAAGATLAAAAPIIGIGVAIAAGIAIVIALIQSWKELWNAAQVIWKAITDIVVAPFKLLMDLGKACYKILVGLFTLDPKMLTQGVNEIGGAFSKFTDTLVHAGKETMNALGNAGSAIWNNMVNNAKSAASIFQGTLTDSKRINKQLTEEDKKLLEQRKAFEEEWSKKLRNETASRGELLEAEKKEALAKAKELGAKKQDIEAYYAKKSEDLAREENQAKERFEQQFTEKVEDSIEERLRKLRTERDQNILEAKRLHADKTKVEEYYRKQEIKLIEEAEKKKRAIVEENEKKKRAAIIETIQKGLAMAKNILGKLSGLFNQYYDNRSKEIDAHHENEKKRIMESQMSEEEKKVALDALDQDTEKKKKQLAREQAQTNKTMGIFNAIIDTAEGIVAALGAGWPIGFIMAALAGAMGAAQIALISAQPLPALASGGTITSSGMALVGEQGPELVNLPQAASVIPLNRPQLSAAGLGGYNTANITLEIDGRALVKQLGTPLRDMIRIKTGLK